MADVLQCTDNLARATRGLQISSDFFPLASEIKKDVPCADGQIVGTYDPGGGSEPNAPGLTVAQLTTTSLRATLTGEAGVQHYLLLAAGSGAWEAAGNRTGNGTIDKVGLTKGQVYTAIAYSQDGDYLSQPSRQQTLMLGTADNLEVGLYQYILSHPGVSAIINDRFYPLVIPQEVSLPAVAYSRIAGGSTQVMAGSNGQAQARIQIKVRANEYDEAKNVAEAIRLALNGYPGGTMGTITVQSCLSIEGSEHDEHDKIPGAKDVFGVSRDFEFFYEETKPSFN